MSMKPGDLKVAKLPEHCHVWDYNANDWETAFRRDFKRQRIITPVDAVLFDTTAESFTSNLFYVAPYAKGLLLINLDVTGAPTDIITTIQFSDDRLTWFNYVIGPFGDLRYEDAAGDKKECLDFPILAPFMRLYLLSAGCGQGATFLMTCKVILNG